LRTLFDPLQHCRRIPANLFRSGISSPMRAVLKSLFPPLGIEVRRTPPDVAPGSAARPIAEIRSFLEDIKARGFPPRGIVDVGANRGDWAQMAISVFPGASVLMIEPQDEMEPSLSRLAVEIPTCHYVKAAVGREEGELIQTIWEDLAGSSFLPAPNPEALMAGKQRKTKVTTIDSLLSGPYAGFHPDLVKLDIQGFELEALSGAEATFGKTEVFILETSLFQFLPRQPLTREVMAFMSDRGYELYDITGFLRRPYDGALGQVDLAFVKSRGMFRATSAW
jgi:FkbM family methyltransferase